jgi:hypothetical protein
MELLPIGAQMRIAWGGASFWPDDGAGEFMPRGGGVFPNLEATTMATLPADEDYARSVLTIFRGRRVQAKQSLKSTQVKAEFLSHNLGRAPDYDAAVEYALEQGWITLQLGLIRLTEAGFAEL